MKRTVTVLLLCTALCATVFAQTGDDFEIKQNAKGTITITRYTGKATKVTIPSTIEGIKVTEIGLQCFDGVGFDGYKNIIGITIPDSITSIGDYAFRYCTGLTSVTIPDSVTTIGNGAFKGCTSLTSVTIGNKVTNIGASAFIDCTSLKNITIPDSVTSIGQSAFAGCSSLTNVIIPNSVTSIRENAFMSCRNITSVTIGNKVTSIGDRAFSGCTRLTNVIIPDNVTSIGVDAFNNCDNITSVTIAANKNYARRFPNNFAAYYESQGKKAGIYIWSGRLWKIDTSAEEEQARKEAEAKAKMEAEAKAEQERKEAEAKALAQYTAESGFQMTKIDTGIVINKYVGNKTVVEIPSVILDIPVIGIDKNAFSKNTNITSITIAESVTGIGEGTFSGCNALTSVTFATGSNITDASFGNKVFPEGSSGSGGNTLKTAYASGKAGTYTRAAMYCLC
ncbi:leucine-rich repeat protein [Treponema sp. R80B11-R83G3]